jgi:hypothetical protein
MLAVEMGDDFAWRAETPRIPAVYRLMGKVWRR